MIKMPCPYCGTRLAVPEAKVGKSGRCSACKEKFVVPHRSRPTRRSVHARSDDDSGLVIEPDDDSSLVIEPDDDVPLEIVDFVDDPASGKSPHPRFRTEVFAESTDVPEAVFERIRRAIDSHRDAVEEGVFNDADLSISVDQYDPGSQFLRYMFPFLAGAARVKISVTGTVNRESIEAETSAARYIGAFGGSSERMLKACLQDCIADLDFEIDAAAGREVPPFARFWRHIRLVRWVIAAVVFIVFLGLFLAFHPAKPGAKNDGGEILVMFLGGLFASAASFGIISFSALIFAPGDFLLNQRDGMKAMTRIGVTSPLALRIVATLVLLISCGAFALAVMFLLDGR
jgi:hypothetical protein